MPENARPARPATISPSTCQRRATAILLLGMACATALAQVPEPPLGCLIQPDMVAEVGSPVIGVLESIKVERGDRVKKGQVLATLRAEVEQAALAIAKRRSDAQASLRAAETEHTYAQQRAERSEELRRQNFISDQALDLQRTEAQVAGQRLAQAREQRDIFERELRLARTQMDQRVIRSPFAGIVLERYRVPGERVEEKPILRLASLDPLRVEVFMPASRYGKFKTGTTLQVVPDLPGASARAATVTRIDQVVDPASNTFRVQLRLPNHTNPLPSGLRCKIEGLGETPAATPARPGN